MISWDETVQNMAIVPTSTEPPTTRASLPRRIASKFIFVDVWPKWIDLFISTKNNWLEREREREHRLPFICLAPCSPLERYRFFWTQGILRPEIDSYTPMRLFYHLTALSRTRAEYMNKKWSWRIKTKRSIEHKHAHTWGSNFPLPPLLHLFSFTFFSFFCAYLFAIEDDVHLLCRRVK